MHRRTGAMDRLYQDGADSLMVLQDLSTSIFLPG
jgi:hypothetical protein